MLAARAFNKAAQPVKACQLYESSIQVLDKLPRDQQPREKADLFDLIGILLQEQNRTAEAERRVLGTGAA